MSGVLPGAKMSRQIGALPRWDRLDAWRSLDDFAGMSTASIRTSKASPRKVRARTKGRAVNKGPSFGEWARRVAGMVKSAPSDLSTRKGFGEAVRKYAGIVRSGSGDLSMREGFGD